VSSVKEAESPEHTKLVKGLIEYLRQQGFETVCAAYESYTRCAAIQERVPNVMGKNAQGLVAIGEAKTCDDLDNDRTNDRLKLFSSCLMGSGSLEGQAIPFYIGIPKDCVGQLKQRLTALGIDRKLNVHIVHKK
jgi:hypothetical protein